MHYSNDGVRRQDRLMNESEAKQLLQQGEYGVLSMQNEEGRSYGIPVNYAWDGHSLLYLHCASEGHKLHCIAKNEHVSFCVVGRTRVIPDKFTTAYESIVLSCTAQLVTDDTERMKALELLLDKYSPDDKTAGMQYARQSLSLTAVICLDINQWSGKTKRIAS
ncbi:MAG: pyridoxamine 5'-phosphate oxidase family protein [Bacteroidales bacterium]|nr:pyridoxamine 5'-phosphate oxidase family protein [Bacteroidales bacterium]